MDAHVGEALQALAQDCFEDRLMEVPVAGPAVRARPVDAAPDHQGAAFGVDEVHALRRGPRDGGDLLGQPGRLEDAHDLAVEMHGARQRMDLAVALVDVDRESGLAQQVRQQRADRAAADDGDVSTQECSASHTRSGVAGMLMCLPPSASTMAFITDGSEPAQPASPQPLAPSTLVLAGTE